jgi:hypothetical protein
MRLGDGVESRPIGKSLSRAPEKKGGSGKRERDRRLFLGARHRQGRISPRHQIALIGQYPLA